MGASLKRGGPASPAISQELRPPRMVPAPWLPSSPPHPVGDPSHATCRSSGGPDAHWCLHLAASEWGAELRGAAE